ncbi:MAG: hypothetical protein A3J48_02160 [Candidatus Doudnabacteria bacterium RIFCSPHIGHO2_02_FULL_46_11]|uniref:Fimbrial assembly protein n=1 Tax=Candidatus Doudnabacteria bacterium RIFCSPHIGHO2_02_FULL_46_11 TaxID=1817832 RepID=A0A1F5P4J4_9BACT|nr:MAG: hypothetical protein A3J48_02160 [Candidatus Doudnabacteria bacterium RIFCSPHIGHO2_02_FULL_46_11]
MKLANLLPKNYVQSYKLYLGLLYAKRLFLDQTIIALLVGVILGAQFFVLREQTDDLAHTAANLNKLSSSINVAELQKAADDQAERLKAVSEVIKIKSDFSPFIDEFIEQVPPGVTLQSVILDSSKKQIDVSGRASAREQIVLLHSRLESSESLKIVYAPLSNLTAATDASFRFIVSFTTAP